MARRMSPQERHEEIQRLANKMPPDERREFLRAAVEYDTNIGIMYAVLGGGFVIALLVMELMR